MIRWRQKAGVFAGLGLSAGFALALVVIATAERWTGLDDPPLSAGESAPITIRAPERSAGAEAGGAIVVRGDIVSPAQAARLAALRAEEISPLARGIGLGIAFALIGAFLAAALRATHRGRLLRSHATALTSVIVYALGAKLLLLFTPLSAFVIPAAALVLLIAHLLDRIAGVATAVALGLITSVLGPFDPALGLALATQGIGAVLVLKKPGKREHFLLSGLVGGLAAALAAAASLFLLAQRLPAQDLADPSRSVLLAALGGGLLAGPLASILRSPMEGLFGDIPKARLIELADLQSPLLRQIAAEAPGTWQHSLAMANMAEIAANAIGANALLVRVGAYYHDLGKSLQPQYYIENLAAGQPSPHDPLPPEVSADAIFAHVTEGVRLARARKLPEAVVDFMHMHHGDGLLEYFWGKCLEQGNPRGLSARAFRYPGVKPQTRETAILAICDAVEAASRTLRQPEARSIEALVQRIVYGKLHLGQLDESGLSVADLQVLANTLVTTLKHAHHVRIEYPWQKEERAAEAAAATPVTAGDEVTTSQQMARQPLDSAEPPAGALAETILLTRPARAGEAKEK